MLIFKGALLCILPQLPAQGDQADHAGREVFFGMVYDVQGPQQGLLEGTHDYGASFRIPLRQQLRQDGHSQSLGHGFDEGLGARSLLFVTSLMEITAFWYSVGRYSLIWLFT